MHSRIEHWDKVQRLAAKALANGASRNSFGAIEWDCAGNCQEPYRRATIGRPPAPMYRDRMIMIGPGTKTTIEVVIWLRCNHCRTCLARRAALWRRRATHELLFSARTWMGTLTFKPSERYRLLAKASAEYGPGFDGLPAHHQYRLIERQAYKEVQKYWKRVREESNQPLRYFMVAEEHRDGSLHYHAFVHERAGSELRWKTLSSQWQAGFSKWKLCDRNPASVRYVTKYLTVAIHSRARASVSYGEFSLFKGSERNERERNTEGRGNPTARSTRGEANAEVIETEEMMGGFGGGHPQVNCAACTELTGRTKDGTSLP